MVGGIFNNGGSLTVSSTTISNNIADGTSGSGGGIFNLTPGTLSVDGITISGNTANRAGGGIEISSATGETYSFNNVTFSGNNIATANPGNGGAFHISGPGNSTFTDCTVANNTAAEGGGLWNGSGTMTVSGGTYNNNEATGNDPDQGGGALFNNGGTMIVNNFADIYSNIATGTSGSGGALLSPSASSTWSVGTRAAALGA